MKQIKREIFQKLSLAFIGIIFIPILFIGIFLVLSTSKNIEEKIEKDNYYQMTNIVSELNNSYAKLEKIKLLIRTDFEFLNFLTSDKKKTGIELYEFKTKKLSNYNTLISISKEIKEFKLYVDNENIIELRPFITNELPKDLNERTLFIEENGKNYIYYFREIKFLPTSVYMEVKLDLEEITGKSEENYYFYRNNMYFNINSSLKLNLSDKFDKYVGEINDSEFGSVKNRELVTYYSYCPAFKVHLLNVVSRQVFLKRRKFYIFTAFAVILLSLVAIYFISYFVSIRLFKQLEYIIKAVKEVKEGNLDARIPIENKTNEFYMLSTQFNAMAGRIKALIKENVKRETIAKDFQIKALQSQINSHFMQNTIENIKMLAFINEDYEVSDALTNLGIILRYGMDWKIPVVAFEEEMDYLQRYVELFSFRIENDISFRYYVEDELLKKEIPKMLIQPMVENAILHGIIPKRSQGYIQVRAYYSKENSKIKIIEILDNGVGIDKSKKPKGTGIGMENMEARLRLHFEGEINIEIKSIKNKFTRFIIKIEEKW